MDKTLNENISYSQSSFLKEEFEIDIKEESDGEFLMDNDEFTAYEEEENGTAKEQKRRLIHVKLPLQDKFLKTEHGEEFESNPYIPQDNSTELDDSDPDNPQEEVNEDDPPYRSFNMDECGQSSDNGGSTPISNWSGSEDDLPPPPVSDNSLSAAKTPRYVSPLCDKSNIPDPKTASLLRRKNKRTWNYTDKDMKEAIKAVKGGMRKSDAQRIFKIPANTLGDAIKGRYLFGRPSRASFLDLDLEMEFNNFLSCRSEIGCTFDMKDISILVKEFADYKKVDGSFPSNNPSYYWIQSYLDRFPDLRVINQKMAKVDGNRTDNLLQWFQGINKYLEDNYDIDTNEFLTEENGDQIFIIDSVAFELKGMIKNSSKKSSNNPQITSLVCSSASNFYLKSHLIFPESEIAEIIDISSKYASEFDTGWSSDGVLSPNSFYKWFTELFFPSIKDNVYFPILVFIDSDVVSLNYLLWEFCQKNHIILYYLPCLLKPLGVSVLSSFKKNWNEILFEMKNENSSILTREQFITTYGKCWSSVKEQNVISIKFGFQETGLIPFNATIDSVFSESQNKEEPLRIRSLSPTIKGTSRTRALAKKKAEISKTQKVKNPKQQQMTPPRHDINGTSGNRIKQNSIKRLNEKSSHSSVRHCDKNISKKVMNVFATTLGSGMLKDFESRYSLGDNKVKISEDKLFLIYKKIRGIFDDIPSDDNPMLTTEIPYNEDHSLNTEIDKKVAKDAMVLQNNTS